MYSTWPPATVSASMPVGTAARKHQGVHGSLPRGVATMMRETGGSAVGIKSLLSLLYRSRFVLHTMSAPPVHGSPYFLCWVRTFDGVKTT